MPNITIKNIPDDLYDRLKKTAKAHHRSINRQVIHSLETLLMPAKASAEDRIHQARRVRPPIDPDAVTQEEIQQAIREGRL